MSEFIERLEEWSSRDSKVRAVLRRSLTFDLGKFPSAYPYVEIFLNSEENSWKREMYYLVAGLWAAHRELDKSRGKISIAQACAEYLNSTKSSSFEKRFIAVIDADSDQLPHRLRYLVAILKDYPIDFSVLLKDLLYWNSKQKHTQMRWAREFYMSSYSAKQE